MRLGTRKLLDRAFSGFGVVAIAVMGATLVVVLAPIVRRGIGAYIFRGTIEHRRIMFELFARGDGATLRVETAACAKARQPVYDAIARLEALPRRERRRYRRPLRALKKELAGLLGPLPGEKIPALLRGQYGEPRWDRVEGKLQRVLYRQEWVYPEDGGMGTRIDVPRAKDFAGTPVESLFPYLEKHVREMMRPRLTVYARFLTDPSRDAHFFGGIGPEVLGTFYLTLGAMIFAVPLGIIAAVYLCEYARPSGAVDLLRTCIGTLAGVPSIVFGLFGMAFFLNTLHVSESKSVLAGSLTLALMMLPMVIRTSEEAIRAVPPSYREAALGLGAGRWRTVTTVILPAALPGVLTGIVISMGRVAGETAPIIFTAAVSVGRCLSPLETLSQPTPALPWNIYNLCTEHEAVDQIRHVQFGMVFTLVALVLLLNLAAIVLRARISKKLRG